MLVVISLFGVGVYKGARGTRKTLEICAPLHLFSGRFAAWVTQVMSKQVEQKLHRRGIHPRAVISSGKSAVKP